MQVCGCSDIKGEALVAVIAASRKQAVCLQMHRVVVADDDVDVVVADDDVDVVVADDDVGSRPAVCRCIVNAVVADGDVGSRPAVCRFLSFWFLRSLPSFFQTSALFIPSACPYHVPR
ncbi:hypothetical protein J5N97_017678 [Dioscorea zingiberensis]|uniref:Uncharacterized protein n=1 Tax=Dioscorea zingiberensis TaxID=325984 RepID=A0A9D5CNP4_9LILI|nr:hypothetical protein J5N97_017678 [Dioscorea zingiberensis]